MVDQEQTAAQSQNPSRHKSHKGSVITTAESDPTRDSHRQSLAETIHGPPRQRQVPRDGPAVLTNSRTASQVSLSLPEMILSSLAVTPAAVSPATLALAPALNPPWEVISCLLRKPQPPPMPPGRLQLGQAWLELSTFHVALSGNHTIHHHLSTTVISTMIR